MQSNADICLQRYGLRMPFDSRRLPVLQAIAEHRSFTRAAEALVMTQPAVSRQLAALETEVGVQLVERGPRHVSLTPAGAALVEEAKSILPALGAAERRLQSFVASDGGAIRFGAVPSAMVSFVPAALAALRVARPRAEVELREGWSADLSRLAGRGDLDLAVVSEGEGAGEPAAALLLREPLMVLMPSTHRLARRRRLPLADLSEEPWLVATEPAGRSATAAAFADAGFAPRVVGTVAWNATGQLVAAGLGLALAPRITAQRIERTDAVVAKALQGAPARELRLIRAARRAPTPIEQELETQLRAAVLRAA
jgi:DNA-binding transcriptional LysR family regulator